ncbi:hypothetical protein F1D05_10720 [Kribbella qitaiheensis]|uniref:Uncharacterized protein n=1 Tax=Kribbella qitaiheensis TaxID=1544730 RepID=A0A7G6WWB4_9ACTN|nr:hypothetical protein [Kribbella qitaiheensis]QNE18279.1 hypothetical protein F1D05_10720 [Kribbella qitaiheensis]
MNAAAAAPAEKSRVLVTLAGLPIIDHIIDADRADWFAAAMARRYRSCQVSSAPYQAEGYELVGSRPGEQS